MNFIPILYSLIFPVFGSTFAVLSKTSIACTFLIVFTASLTAVWLVSSQLLSELPEAQQPLLWDEAEDICVYVR